MKRMKRMNTDKAELRGYAHRRHEPFIGYPCLSVSSVFQGFSPSNSLTNADSRL
jgi:hypothetical protein